MVTMCRCDVAVAEEAAAAASASGGAPPTRSIIHAGAALKKLTNPAIGGPCCTALHVEIVAACTAAQPSSGVCLSVCKAVSAGLSWISWKLRSLLPPLG